MMHLIGEIQSNNRLPIHMICYTFWKSNLWIKCCENWSNVQKGKNKTIWNCNSLRTLTVVNPACSLQGFQFSQHTKVSESISSTKRSVRHISLTFKCNKTGFLEFLNPRIKKKISILMKKKEIIYPLSVLRGLEVITHTNELNSQFIRASE